MRAGRTVANTMTGGLGSDIAEVHCENDCEGGGSWLTAEVDREGRAPEAYRSISRPSRRL